MPAAEATDQKSCRVLGRRFKLSHTLPTVHGLSGVHYNRQATPSIVQVGEA
jgi:hypothetical protein